MLGRMTPRPGEVLMVSGRQDYSAHRLRIQGFREVLSQRFPHLQLSDVLAGEERREQITRLVEQALCRSRNIVGIYNTGLGNTQIAEALARHRREGDVCWITHERYNTTRQQLAKGSPALTLDQNTRQHAQLAIDLMLRHLSPATSRKPMPTVKSTLSSTAPRTWTKAYGASLPDNTDFPGG